MGLEATLLLGHYSQKPLTLWVVGNGSTDHLEDIWASVIMGQTPSRVAHKVSSQRYNSTYTAIGEWPIYTKPPR